MVKSCTCISILSKSLFFFFWKPNSFVIYYWVWVQSNYKASIAGGGESSNQISSSSTYLAYLANEWATKFALLCTIQVPEASIVYCTECDPMDNSVKPASIANSKAFPQAMISTSSLSTIERPLADINVIGLRSSAIPRVLNLMQLIWMVEI